MKEADKEYIDKQSELFEQAKSQLLEKYCGKYVLFEDGQVLDSDDDRARLVMRAYESGGMRVLFTKFVTEEEEDIGAVWTPFGFTRKEESDQSQNHSRL